MNLFRIKAFLCVIIALCLTFNLYASGKHIIDLKGKWQFRLDTARVGEKESWYEMNYDESVILPGTTATNAKGFKNNVIKEDHLTSRFFYEGKAWYKRKVTIPESWRGKTIKLYLERTKQTQIWINSKYVGSIKQLSTPHVYNVGKEIEPGENWIVIAVDNTRSLFPVGGSHAMEISTQTNWNGIVGEMKLIAYDQVYATIDKITPDVDGRKAKIELTIHNSNEEALNTTLTVSAKGFNSKQADKSVIPSVSYVKVLNRKTEKITLDYPMGNSFLKWDDYTPNLYKLKIDIAFKGNKTYISSVSDNFGMCKFEAKGRKFYVNNKPLFLRSKNDACVFPLTGYPAMTKDEWIRQMRISKSYGLNAYRFHTWTPPKACFEAADIVGIYLQPELPNWKAFDNTKEGNEHYRFQFNEGFEIFKFYGNHPSFVFFALGNELGGSRSLMSKILNEFRPYSGNILLAQGSNNYFWDPLTLKEEDFFVTAKTGKYSPDFKTEIRASFAFVDDPMGGGVLNRQYPGNKFTFSEALNGFDKPVVSHETGQYQVLPNFDEMKKYKGVMLPLNFEVFKKRMIANKIYGNWRELFKASGALSALCYRADHEMMLRTPEMAGFQILDLQDFPGQGTALVGMLDAFMDSKNIITPEKWRRSCNDVTLQAELDKYVWTNAEELVTRVKLLNYSQNDISGRTVRWELKTQSGVLFSSGTLDVKSAACGEIACIGEIKVDLKSVAEPQQFELILRDIKSDLINDYRVWVYPAKVVSNSQVRIYRRLTDDLLNRIEAGEKIVLVPDTAQIKQNSMGGLFTSDYWNYAMFKGISIRAKKPVSPGTMGLLINHKHPVFDNFPTGKYSDWQWWSIVKNSRPIFLNATNEKYRPIVQVIDNVERASKLGLMFEFKVGKGAVLVCSADLSLKDDVAIEALKTSIVRYVSSKEFEPKEQISKEELLKVLYKSEIIERVRSTNLESNIEGYFN